VGGTQGSVGKNVSAGGGERSVDLGAREKTEITLMGKRADWEGGFRGGRYILR